MATESMKIVIGADISQVTNSLKVASSNVEQFGDSVTKAFDEVAASAAAMGRVSDLVDRLVAESLGAGDALERTFQQPLKSIAQLEAEIESLESEISKTTDFRVLDDLNKDLERTKAQLANFKIVAFENNLGRIGPSATNAASGLKKVSSAASAGNLALTDINRVLQDLPFGFVSIQNNITELPGKFRALSLAAKESGQSVGKIFLSSLIGAGGIGTALSLITSALTFATVGFGAWTRGLTGSGKAAKNAKEDIDDFSQILQEVGNEVGRSAARITTLFNALNSGTLNTSQRKKALDELKQQNNEFFGALKEEKGIIEGLETAYNNYLQKIKQIATAKAIETQLTKLFDKKLELELSIDPKFLAATSKDTQLLIGNLKKQLNQLGGAVDFSKEQVDLSKGINENLRQRIDLQTRIKKLESTSVVDLSGTGEQIQQIERQITGLLELQKTTGNFDIAGGKTGEKDVDLLKRRIDALKKLREEIGLTAAQQVELAQLEIQLAGRDAVKLGFTQSELKDQIEGILETTFPVKTFAFELEAQPDLKLLPAKIPTNIDVVKALNLEQIPVDFAGPIVEKMKIIGEKMKELKLEERARAQAEVIAGVLTPAFDGLFNAILTGQNAFNAVGDAIKRLITDMAKAVIRAAALAAIFSLIFPASKGGAGFLGNFKKFLGGGFADGGVATGPKSGYLALLHGTELIVPMDKIGRSNSAGVQGAAFDQPIILQPSVAIQGQALRILLNRVDATNGRLF